MGIPFFSTLTYDYLIQSIDKLRQINLYNQNVIIDGNSFLYFMYKTILMEDKGKPMVQRLTATPFGYDGCWEKFRDTLTVFKDRCSIVNVVFDGIFQLNSRRRSDPDRTSYSHGDADEKQNRLPILLRHEFMNILRELEIEISVAHGEADSTVVQMAWEKNTYVVAYDSDYHLYKLPQGFVSLRYLDLKTLIGPIFQMSDVFGRMSASSVALWATLIANDFISLENLQVSYKTNSVRDRKDFSRWLESTWSDGDKRQWITTQWTLLRFIQSAGETEVYNQLVQSFSPDERSQFDQIKQDYINIKQKTSLIARNGCHLPSFLVQRFISGEFDRVLIDVLINRKLSIPSQSLSLLHLHLLLPICHVLLTWNRQNGDVADFNPNIIYKEKQYNPFDMVKNEDIPLLIDIPNIPKNDQENQVLNCIRFALQSQVAIRWNGVNKDYILWLSLLELWYKEQDKTTSTLKAILLALIISFLKHVLLDTYDKQERSKSNKELSPPFLQYSPEELKNSFSLKICASLRERMNQYSETISSNDPIKLALQEFEQFYDDLAMINQFYYYPLFMPQPHECISQLTYRLAVVFSTSKNLSKEINVLFKDNTLLANLIEEIQNCINKS